LGIAITDEHDVCDLEKWKDQCRQGQRSVTRSGCMEEISQRTADSRNHQEEHRGLLDQGNNILGSHGREREILKLDECISNPKSRKFKLDCSPLVMVHWNVAAGNHKQGMDAGGTTEGGVSWSAIDRWHGRHQGVEKCFSD
jgi:hypothetical protein